jgi:uncharacterized protein
VTGPRRDLFRVRNGMTLTEIQSTSAQEPLREHRSNAAEKRRTRLSGITRMAMRIVRDVVVIYFGFLTLLYSFQTRVIFPGASTQGQPFAEVQPRRDAELVTLKTARGERVVALFGPAIKSDGRIDSDAASRPTMIYFYGNAMCLNYAVQDLDRFRRLGLNVLIPDYVGYGMSGGSPSEKGCQATSDAAYDYLVSTRRIDSKNIFSAGWSLGGSVAIDLASRRQVGGLIVFSTFTSGVAMARRMLPFVPVSLLLRHRFDSLHKIAKVHCPILIGHGGRDPAIPFQMAKKLAAAAGGPVTTLWIDQAEHNDFFEVGGRRIDQAITRFIEEHVDGVPRSAR